MGLSSEEEDEEEGGYEHVFIAPDLGLHEAG